MLPAIRARLTVVFRPQTLHRISRQPPAATKVPGMMHARDQQAFSAAADPPSATAAEEDAAARIRRFGKAMISALFKRCANLLSSDWRILQWRRQTNEAVISSVGPIEIRQ